MTQAFCDNEIVPVSLTLIYAPVMELVDMRDLGAVTSVKGKYTARVTKIFNQPDGSTVKATRRINKDGSITDKIEHRHR